MASGTFLRGSFTSPATQVMYTHPSYAQKTAIKPTPNAEINCAGPRPALKGTPCALKFDQFPLPIAKPSTTNAAMAKNLVQVETFCNSVPQRKPMTFT